MPKKRHPRLDLEFIEINRNAGITLMCSSIQKCVFHHGIFHARCMKYVQLFHFDISLFGVIYKKSANICFIYGSVDMKICDLINSPRYLSHRVFLDCITFEIWNFKTIKKDRYFRVNTIAILRAFTVLCQRTQKRLTTIRYI